MRVLYITLLIVSFLSGAQPNLIVNPSAALTPLTSNGWTEVCGNAACEWTGTPVEKDNTFGPSSHDGDGAHFYPGDNNSSFGDELYQNVDVSAYATAIDAGTGAFRFIAWMAIWRTNNDKCRVTWEFRNAGGTVLTSYNSGDYGSQNWTSYDNTQTAPVGTRIIRIRLHAYKVWPSGTAYDSYYDDLSLTTTAPLPVSLVNFNATEKSKSILLSWSTSSETDNHYFTIEKSIDGNNWFEIGKVYGVGNSTQQQNYTISDEHPQTGVQYYRLRQTDTDGMEANYDPISVHFRSEIELLLYPNPTSGILTLTTSDDALSSSVRILNLTGQIVLEEEVSGNVHEFDVRTLPAGVYILEYSNAGQVSRTTLKKE